MFIYKKCKTCAKFPFCKINKENENCNDYIKRKLEMNKIEK